MKHTQTYYNMNMSYFFFTYSNAVILCVQHYAMSSMPCASYIYSIQHVLCTVIVALGRKRKNTNKGSVSKKPGPFLVH